MTAFRELFFIAVLSSEKLLRFQGCLYTIYLLWTNFLSWCWHHFYHFPQELYTYLFLWRGRSIQQRNRLWWNFTTGEVIIIVSGSNKFQTDTLRIIISNHTKERFMLLINKSSTLLSPAMTGLRRADQDNSAPKGARRPDILFRSGHPPRDDIFYLLNLERFGSNGFFFWAATR